MENKYKIENGEIIGVVGEINKTEKSFNFGNIDLRVFVTKEKEYYNFYILNEMFKQEPLNNLDIQEPLSFIDDLSEKELIRFMEERAITFYLWYKYNRDYSILSEKI